MEYGNDFDFSYGVPDGPTMSSSGSDIFSVIMTVYLLVIVAAVIIGIVKYVFKSIALYRLAQRTGNANPWMAWVPFARSYLQGDLAGSMPLKKRRLQSPGLWKVLFPFHCCGRNWNCIELFHRNGCRKSDTDLGDSFPADYCSSSTSGD